LRMKSMIPIRAAFIALGSAGVYLIYLHISFLYSWDS
jgi:hypothetical protein